MPAFGPWVTPPTYNFSFDLHDTDSSLPIDFFGDTTGRLYAPAPTPSDARALAEVTTFAVDVPGTLADPVTPSRWTSRVNTPGGPGVAPDAGLRVGPNGAAAWASAGSGSPSSARWQAAQMNMSLGVYLADRPPATLPPGVIGWEWEPTPGAVTAARWELDTQVEVSMFHPEVAPALTGEQFHIYKRTSAELAGVDPTFVRDVDTTTLGFSWRLDAGDSYWLLESDLVTRTPDVTITFAAAAVADTIITGHVTVPVVSADFNAAEVAISWVSHRHAADIPPPDVGAAGVFSVVTTSLVFPDRIFAGTYQPRRYRFIRSVLPPLRQFPRDDALGGAPRQGKTNGPTSVQGSTRQGWRGTYR